MSKKPFWFVDEDEIKKDGDYVIRFDPSAKYEPPKYIFEINQNFLYNEVEKYKQYAGLVTESCILLIDGKPKSKKTTFANMMIAAHLSENGRYENIHCKMDPNKFVFYFDTEQNKQEFNNTINNTLRISGHEECPDILQAFNIKFVSSPEKKINQIIYHIEKHIQKYTNKHTGKIKEQDKIGIIVIDQIADLVNDVNDTKEIKDLVDFFNALTRKTDALLILVMHKNKTNNLPNGALGYEMQKKSTVYLSAQKKSEKEESNETPSKLYVNEARIPVNFKSFWFNYDKRGYPVIID